MTTQEFSNAFDTLLNSYNTQAQFGDQSSRGDIVLDEYEKSLLLTRAQEEVVVNLYNGKNPYGDSFESTEEMRRYLESLVETKIYQSEEQVSGVGLSENSVFYELPSNLAFITMEQVVLDDEALGCYNGNVISVYPITQDEYNKVRGNPFRGPTKYKALRLDTGNNIVEIISKYKVGEYLLKYLKRPEPIILEDLPEDRPDLAFDGDKREHSDCKLNPILHSIILNRAVQMAIQAKGMSVNK